MRILYVSPRNFWPPNSGARLRDYYLLRELAARNTVSFFGISSIGDGDYAASSPQKSPDFGLQRSIVVQKGRSYTVRKILRGLLGPTPITVLNYQDSEVARDLARLLEQQAFDLVQVEGIHLLSYLPLVRSSRGRPLVVCDWHDIESELMHRYGLYTASWARRLYAMRTAGLLEKAERELLKQCDAHIAVSERDRSKLQELVPQAQLHVVENGVDASQYSDAEMERVLAKLPRPNGGGRRDVVFVGSMDFHANIDAARYFALDVWPKIREQSPDLRFLIVGSRPVAEVKELGNLPGVTVTGTVEDIRPYYHGALAAVVPLRIGGGTRLKILEAMAAGIPVVSTTVGAEGLAVSPDANILIGDTPADIGRAVAKLHDSPGRWHQLSEAGRELARTRYDWSVIGRSLHQIHCSLFDGQLHG